MDELGRSGALRKTMIRAPGKEYWHSGGQSASRRRVAAQDDDMEFQSPNDARTDAPISDRVLRAIVEQGFFGARGSLADARAACAELIFARALIEAQTARIVQLDSAAAIS